MPQSRLMAEAVANVVLCCATAVATQIVVFPRFGIEATLAQGGVHSSVAGAELRAARSVRDPPVRR